MKYKFDGKSPQLARDVFIAPTAVVIGEAKLKERASIWFNTIVRADINSIEIGEDTNIQDNCTVHVTYENGVKIGDRVTVGHGVVLHGCTVESDCLIAMGSVLLDGAKISKGSIVGAGAVVAPGTIVPEESLVMGIPAKVVRKLHQRDRDKFKKNWQNYVQYAKQYADKSCFSQIDE